MEYYEKHADLWEIQALLKARPIAGAMAVGDEFLRRIRPVLAKPRTHEDIAASIHGMRKKTLRANAIDAAADVKSGLGGIRDVEFLVQGLQLLHLSELPELMDGNTVRALEKLANAALLAPAAVSELTADYLFLRRVEHFLQIFEDRQVHAVPRDAVQLRALSRRALGPEAEPGTFTERLRAVQGRIRQRYGDYIE